MRRPVSGGRRGRRGEQGNVTLLAAFTALGVAAVLMIVIGAFTAQIVRHRVEGAADLVALTAAQVRNTGSGVPCEAAARAAVADGVELLACEVAGREAGFVVTVSVRGGAGRELAGVPLQAEAQAHAGVRGLA